MEKEIYQIVNISDLEKKIQKTRIEVMNILIQIKEKQLTEMQIVELLENIQNTLFECESFEFVLERRLLKD